MNNKTTSQVNSPQHNWMMMQITRWLNEVRNVDETETQFTSPGCSTQRRCKPLTKAHWPRQTQSRSEAESCAAAREARASRSWSWRSVTQTEYDDPFHQLITQPCNTAGDADRSEGELGRPVTRLVTLTGNAGWLWRPFTTSWLPRPVIKAGCEDTKAVEQQ